MSQDKNQKENISGPRLDDVSDVIRAPNTRKSSAYHYLLLEEETEMGHLPAGSVLDLQPSRSFLSRSLSLKGRVNNGWNGVEGVHVKSL